ncbi:MAG TPA: thermonuclease family protein [Verrucomicrobiae bacterium]|nr:thermonuclease family protein [Verrucomicrobiae bacterium]
MQNRYVSFIIRFSIVSLFLVAIAFGIAPQFAVRPAPLTPSPTPEPLPTTLSVVPAEATEQARVMRVVDGDTVRIEREGEEKVVRLIGINTPESVDPRKPVQCFGKEASLFATGILQDKEIRMSSDESQQDMDRYGRLLRYIYLLDGTFVNEKLIREGYAQEYTYDRPYVFQAAFRQAQKEAQQANVGLWSGCAAAPTAIPD